MNTDTTILVHAWGFELSTSAEVEANIPYHGGSLTTTATASYDGKSGTEHTVTGTQITLGAGIRSGLQAFNFDTVYCTISLEPFDTNCPIFDWMK